ncbi:4-(cytidine 5'-diphospho)-2-C-methyl-D-erythritol kinase [Candidatus Methylacidiphilum infernorum]|uniref:4-diphosphocytidyl-2-C-methyl-D-erythritol kinase n=1 Tax=Candidatus Methylacidiphilum infernorum TaxID=511746 RepID=A0ABX7PVD0_9BACT|nr:4-(cytidine 5'-diphospho)-2-C-methyl-D-erythritol kinase [Candidatus Methylacidiphilum infernorum]QSR86946.1 4-(cytidine 5'-diphospho)-2-C-methyl-D-erythritol kinase [Candidatus Methylacidiphilum infernorum]
MSTSNHINSFAPAKINLGLRIFGKRKDGYHELQTLMAPISIGDRIEITLLSSGIEFETTGEFDVPKDSSNLALKAALLFLSHYGLKTGLRIKLTKIVPPGAGLGGGSSDAAAVLFSLNRLLAIDETMENLIRLAAQLGSDVPFFLLRKPALCTGRGEILQPTSTFPFPRKGLLIYPGFPVSTPWAYKTYDELCKKGLILPSPSQESDKPVNDLEEAVFSKYLWLPAVKKWIQSHFNPEVCLMSGSGSSVFALFSKEDPRFFNDLIQQAQAYLGPSCWIRLFEILEQF